MTHKSKTEKVNDILPHKQGNSLSVMQIYPSGIHLAEQDQGEKIFIILRRHIITNFGWMFIALLMIITPPLILSIYTILPTNFVDTLKDFFSAIRPSYLFIIFLLWYFIVITYMFAKFVDWFYNVYIITSDRIIDYDFFPLASYKISEARLENVEDATQESIGFFPALFNYGDVSIQTAAEKREFDFHSVSDPAWVRDKLMDLVKLKIAK